MRHLAKVLLVVGMLLLIGGILCLAPAGDEWATYQLCATAPRSIPLRELIESGPGENRHVVISAFTFSDDYAKLEQPGSGEKVILCLFPVEHKPPQEEQQDPLVLLILRDKHCLFYEISPQPTEEQLAAICRRTTLEGVVCGLARERYGRQQALEGTPIHRRGYDHALVLKDLRPATRQSALTLIGLSAGMILAGSGALLVGVVRGMLDLREWKKRKQRLLEAAALEEQRPALPPSAAGQNASDIRL
jgi:hypothetical protein